jgi:branched-chain amino acid transport system substrate-binding protein
LTIAVAAPVIGPSTSVGRQVQAGVAAAIDVAGSGGVLGRPIHVLIQDDGCGAGGAAAAAHKVVIGHPAVIIGHTCSGATLAAAPIYAAAGILEITPASTNPAVTEQGIGTLFRVIGRDDRQGIMAAELIARYAAGKVIAIARQDSPYGRDLATAAQAELRRLGRVPAAVIEFSEGINNYLPIIDQMRAARADLLYLVGGAQDCALLVRQLHQLGLRLRIFAGDSAVSSVFWEIAGDGAEGVAFTFPPEIAEQPSTAPAFEAIRRNGAEPTGYSLRAYAAVEIWLAGVTRAQTIDAAAVAAAIRRSPIDTILGSVSFDEKGEMRASGPSFVWYEWQHGQRVRH